MRSMLFLILILIREGTSLVPLSSSKPSIIPRGVVSSIRPPHRLERCAVRMQEATTPSELATAPSAAPSPSDSRLRLYSTVLDYSWMISVGLVLSLLFGSHGRTLSNTSTTLGLVQALAVLGASSVGALYARERVYFRLFRDRIPAIKRQPLSRETQFHLLQTGAISMLSFGLLFKCSAVYWTPFAPRSPRFWCSIVLPFYAILALRDVLLLLPLHTLMHKGGPRFWRLRKSPSPHPGEPFSSRDARSIDAISDSLSLDLSFSFICLQTASITRSSGMRRASTPSTSTRSISWWRMWARPSCSSGRSTARSASSRVRTPSLRLRLRRSKWGSTGSRAYF